MNEQIKQQRAKYELLVEERLPEYAESVKSKGNDVVMLHQDAFAADYQDEEMVLLGAAIKYAGIHDKEVRIIGENRSTITKKNEDASI